ncbi:hypothetical protein CSA08_04370 [Candidatus Gracilibacteria bacterium]|nr:MAG: hypothetical protein CSA08_04370 [Candidatus Gracilibacteria bacterium]
MPELLAETDNNHFFKGKFKPNFHDNGLEYIIYEFSYKKPILGNCESLEDLKNIPIDDFTFECAGKFQVTVDTSLTKLNNYRAEVGSTQNQIESAMRNLMTNYTNIKNAESIIRDVDYAIEIANFNKLNIITQAGSYALAQANNIEKNIIKLLYSP